MFSYAAAVVLCLVALLHSALGELALLRPLFAADWTVPVPRWAAERIFRFAWHLTSLAWVGLAVALAGLPIAHAFALVCLASGVCIFLILRGHLAWPLFLLAAAFAWISIDAIPLLLWQGIAGVGAALSVVLMGLHLYWAAGGRWAIDRVVPTRPDGTPSFRAPPLACIAVAVALGTLGALLAGPLLGTVPSLGRMALLGAAAVLLARAVGDGRQVGFSKSDHSTVFAKADDALFTPLVVLLVFACGSAWMLAAS